MWIDDRILNRCSERLAFQTFVPERNMIVLGRSNQIPKEICENEIKNLQVDVLRRYGGGGTVVLHSGCVVVSVGCWVQDHFANDKYFRILNDLVLDALRLEYCSDAFSQRGISDLCWKDRKFGGTSMFRSRHYLLYQASLLVDAKIDLIEACLKHPPKEPEYRQNRPHRDFLIGLNQPFSELTAHNLSRHLAISLPTLLEKGLANDLVEPISKDINYLHRKAAADD